MKMNRIAVWLAALALAVTAFAADVQVQATGEGPSRRAAVNEALVSALEQYYGATISATERGRVVKATSATSVAQNGTVDDRRKLTLSDDRDSTVQRLANGRIKGYDVASESFDPATKKYRVQLSVRMPGKYVPPGLPEQNRRRMAVVPFRPIRANYVWHGQVGGTAEWIRALEDKLNVCLTQTRKFTMLDRKYDAETETELGRLTAENAFPDDIVRLGQKLGTDYLVVGEVAFNDVAAPAVNPYTGRAVPTANQLFAEITYRVLLAPTGQLKWADVVKIDAAAFPAGDLASFASATAEAAACAISDGMMANILPFEVVGHTASGQLVIGEGGKSLKVGEFLTVFALGEEVKDTRTGEVLDVIEDVVGTVQIVRVSAKTSYAQVVEGDAKKMVVGSRLRRVPLVVPSDMPAPKMVSPVKRTATGGVAAPF